MYLQYEKLNLLVSGEIQRIDDQPAELDFTQLNNDQDTITELESGPSEPLISGQDERELVTDPGVDINRVRFREMPEIPVDLSLDIMGVETEHDMDFDTLLSDANVWDSEDQVLPGLSNDDEIEPDTATIPSAFLVTSSGNHSSGIFILDNGPQLEMTTQHGIEYEDRPGSNDYNFPLSDNLSMSSYLGTTGRDMFSLNIQPSIHSDSPENIALLFDRRVCEVLCIKEEWTGNPWRKIVWPLAQEYPALYHAVAAMTCFYGYNRMPQIRAEGVRHFHESIRSLKLDSNSKMPLEVVLIATLALGLARSWYHPRSSNGFKHIQEAKTLLQNAVSRNVASNPEENNCRLGFIANTWIYMDVITRVTCQKAESVDFNLMIACSQLSRNVASKLQIDPLMGCAGTLFPLIGRVADLVQRIRKSKGRPNSPTIVSLAVELKTAIERWSPSIIPETELNAESLTSSITDLVQTANSYKWAALLLLYQAVPEIPSHLPTSNIAQKVLVLIATVPLDSRAVIFHVLPLMIAGCEATATDDRDWVRARWQSLSSTGNKSGIVERCIELTSEVWRRRDVHKTHCGRCQLLSPLRAGVDPFFTSGPGSLNFQSNGDEGIFNRRYWDNEGHDAYSNNGPTNVFDFKESTVLAFENDRNPRAQCTNHTVKSRLHWLTVMEEWGWEGEQHELHLQIKTNLRQSCLAEGLLVLAPILPYDLVERDSRITTIVLSHPSYPLIDGRNLIFIRLRHW